MKPRTQDILTIFFVCVWGGVNISYPVHIPLLLDLLILEAISQFYESCKARESLSKELLTNVRRRTATVKKEANDRV